MHDSKLQEAAAEVKGILKKYDIAGAAILVSETHAEFFVKPDPSWSAAFIAGGTISVKARRKDFKTAAEHRRVCNLTAHLILQMKDIAGYWFNAFSRMEQKLREHWDIEHESFAGFELHRDQ